MLTDLIESGDVLTVRPLYALRVGHRRTSGVGLTLLDDAAHLMPPFSGEEFNLAPADATDLAHALISGRGWTAVSAFEEVMAARAEIAADGAAQRLNGAFSSERVVPVLEHYRERTSMLDAEV